MTKDITKDVHYHYPCLGPTPAILGSLQPIKPELLSDSSNGPHPQGTPVTVAIKTEPDLAPRHPMPPKTGQNQ